MINLSQTMCPCPTQRVFTPRILPSIFDCECPAPEPFLLQEIDISFLCSCPTETVNMRVSFTESRTRPRDCFEGYIKSIVTEKFCSPKGPKCI